jgi:hypothetical protein
LSYRGVGVCLLPEDSEHLSANQPFLLNLELDAVLAELEGKLIRIDGDIAGIQFLALDDQSRRIISAYLDPRYLGVGLREVPRQFLQDKRRRLFLGPNNTCISIELSGEGGGTAIEKVEFLLLGWYLAVEKGGASLSGNVEPDTAEFRILRELEVRTDDADKEGRRNEMLVQIERLLRYAPLTADLRIPIEIMLKECGKEQ